MLAGILVSPRKIEIRETETSEPSRGEVLVKIQPALTCSTDLKAFLRGHPMIPMPGVFGHEFSGVIAEVGHEVRGFGPGDEVMAVHKNFLLRWKNFFEGRRDRIRHHSLMLAIHCR